MNYPNAPLRDLGFSGLTGGSSSLLARKDSDKNKFYVPLKKRVDTYKF